MSFQKQNLDSENLYLNMNMIMERTVNLSGYSICKNEDKKKYFTSVAYCFFWASWLV